MTRKLVPSTSPYAPVIGFSRAVRVGNHISVGGTAPIDANGKTVGIGDPADWKEIAKVRGEYFKDIRPVDTVVEVKGFINKEWLLEIEVDAVVDES
jgi:enamine deaminase RidA (YjgF/YER057c/UK114 family)